MSHETPSNKPSNSANPRVFFDVDVGGERGQFKLELLALSVPVSLASLCLSLNDILIQKEDFIDLLT